MALVNWSTVTSAVYYAEGAVYNDDTLYFLSDTGEIMKGSKPFTEAYVMVDDAAAGSFEAALEAITAPARRKLYISSTTLAGKIYNGEKWVDVIRPVTDTVAADGVNPVSGKAVAAFVAAEIEKINGGTAFVTGVTYDETKKALVVSNGTENDELVLSGIGVELGYDKETGALTLKDVKGAVLGTSVNLDLERFVSAAAYDETNKQIVLAFTGVTGIAGGTYTYPDTMPDSPTEGLACKAGDVWYKYADGAWAELADADKPLVINVADLVDTYTAGETSTIKLSVANNEFTGAVKVSATEGNGLQVKEDGLYVAPVDLSTCMKLVADAVEGNIAAFGADGQVADSGKKVGGATLAETVDANTLATEAAVGAVRAALTAKLNEKMALVANAIAGNVLTVDADGQATDSGKKVGGATLAETPNENTLATEAAVAAAVKTVSDAAVQKDNVITALASDNTNDQVPSAKAVVEALTWKTTL